MSNTPRFRATGLEKQLHEQGRTREWLARKAGIHASLITHAIAGRRTVSEDVANAIADALDVDLFLLFELPSGSESLPNEQAA